MELLICGYRHALLILMTDENSQPWYLQEFHNYFLLGAGEAKRRDLSSSLSSHVSAAAHPDPDVRKAETQLAGRSELVTRNKMESDICFPPSTCVHTGVHTGCTHTREDILTDGTYKRSTS